MLELLDPTQVRRKHAADWSLIGRTVRVSSNIAVDGTNIQAGATADTVQHLALVRVGQQLTASVVDQDNVEFFRPVPFARTARTTDQRAVRRDPLPRAGSSQHRP